MIAFNCPHCNALLDTENLKIDERDHSTLKRCPKSLKFFGRTSKIVTGKGSI